MLIIYSLVRWADLGAYFHGDLSCVFNLQAYLHCYKVNQHFILVRFDLLAFIPAGLLIRASTVLDLRTIRFFADAYARK